MIPSGAWKNTGTVTVPAYGLARVTGTEQLPDGTLVLTATEPDGQPGMHIINRNSQVAENEYGGYFADRSALVPLAYDTNETPAFGDRVGPTAESGLATLNHEGFTVVVPDSNSSGLVIVSQGPQAVLYKGQTTTDHAKDTSEDVAILTGDKGSETTMQAGSPAADVVVSCYNSHADLATDTIVFFAWVNNGFELVSAGCS
jgi:hypothetical protein